MFSDVGNSFEDSVNSQNRKPKVAPKPTNLKQVGKVKVIRSDKCNEKNSVRDISEDKSDICGINKYQESFNVNREDGRHAEKEEFENITDSSTLQGQVYGRKKNHEALVNLPLKESKLKREITYRINVNKKQNYTNGISRINERRVLSYVKKIENEKKKVDSMIRRRVSIKPRENVREKAKNFEQLSKIDQISEKNTPSSLKSITDMQKKAENKKNITNQSEQQKFVSFKKDISVEKNISNSLQSITDMKNKVENSNNIINESEPQRCISFKKNIPVEAINPNLPKNPEDIDSIMQNKIPLNAIGGKANESTKVFKKTETSNAIKTTKTYLHGAKIPVLPETVPKINIMHKKLCSNMEHCSKNSSQKDNVLISRTNEDSNDNKLFFKNCLEELEAFEKKIGFPSKITDSEISINKMPISTKYNSGDDSYEEITNWNDETNGDSSEKLYEDILNGDTNISDAKNCGSIQRMQNNMNVTGNLTRNEISKSDDTLSVINCFGVHGKVKNFTLSLKRKISIKQKNNPTTNDFKASIINSEAVDKSKVCNEEQTTVVDDVAVFEDNKDFSDHIYCEIEDLKPTDNESEEKSCTQSPSDINTFFKERKDSTRDYYYDIEGEDFVGHWNNHVEESCFYFNCSQCNEINKSHENTSVLNSKLEARSGLKSENSFMGKSNEDQDTPAKKIDKLIEELLSTEEIYISDLSLVVKDYMDEVNRPDASSDLVKNKEQIFGNIENIHLFHLDFQKDLCMSDKTPVAIANCFLKYGDQFKFYREYIRNKPRSELKLRQHKSFFTRKQQELDDLLGLLSHLLKPPQRIIRYVLFLKQICKQCMFSKDGPGALKVDEVVQMLEKEIKLGDDLLALDAIRNLPEYLKKKVTIEELIYKDLFQVTASKPKKKEYTSMVFLFEKMILFTDVQFEDNMEKHYYINEILIHELGFRECRESPEEFEVWKVPRPDITLTLFANEVIKKLWTGAILKLLEEEVLVLREMLVRKKENGQYLDITKQTPVRIFKRV